MVRLSDKMTPSKPSFSRSKPVTIFRDIVAGILLSGSSAG